MTSKRGIVVLLAILIVQTLAQKVSETSTNKKTTVVIPDVPLPGPADKPSSATSAETGPRFTEPTAATSAPAASGLKMDVQNGQRVLVLPPDFDISAAINTLKMLQGQQTPTTTMAPPTTVPTPTADPFDPFGGGSLDLFGGMMGGGGDMFGGGGAGGGGGGGAGGGGDMFGGGGGGGLFGGGGLGVMGMGMGGEMGGGMMEGMGGLMGGMGGMGNLMGGIGVGAGGPGGGAGGGMGAGGLLQTMMMMQMLGADAPDPPAPGTPGAAGQQPANPLQQLMRLERLQMRRQRMRDLNRFPEPPYPEPGMSGPHEPWQDPHGGQGSWHDAPAGGQGQWHDQQGPGGHWQDQAAAGGGPGPWQDQGPGPWHDQPTAEPAGWQGSSPASGPDSPVVRGPPPPNRFGGRRGRPHSRLRRQVNERISFGIPPKAQSIHPEVLDRANTINPASTNQGQAPEPIEAEGVPPAKQKPNAVRPPKSKPQPNNPPPMKPPGPAKWISKARGNPPPSPTPPTTPIGTTVPDTTIDFSVPTTTPYSFVTPPSTMPTPTKRPSPPRRPVRGPIQFKPPTPRVKIPLGTTMPVTTSDFFIPTTTPYSFVNPPRTLPTRTKRPSPPRRPGPIQFEPQSPGVPDHKRPPHTGFRFPPPTRPPTADLSALMEAMNPGSSGTVNPFLQSGSISGPSDWASHVSRGPSGIPRNIQQLRNHPAFARRMRTMGVDGSMTGPTSSNPDLASDQADAAADRMDNLQSMSPLQRLLMGASGMGGMDATGGMGALSGMGGLGGMAGMEGLGGMAGLGGLGGITGMAGMEGLGGMAGLGGLGGMTGMGGMAGMGETNPMQMAMLAALSGGVGGSASGGASTPNHGILSLLG